MVQIPFSSSLFPDPPKIYSPKLKDRTNPSLQASVVYRFKCLGDPSATYIGKTKRYLQIRVGEHASNSSAIHTHLEDCQTCRKNKDNLFSQFNVLQKGNSDFDLQILEALCIIENKPSLNKQLTGSGMSYNLNIF